MKTSKSLFAILIFGAVGISANAQVIYSSIPSPLPPNVSSEGPEAYAFSEIGDGLIFTPGSPRLATTVKVIMSDWACSSGHWYNAYGTADACVTPAGATFSQPVTLHIYAVNSSTTPISAGALLATQTATFNIPYRPSSSVTCFDRGNGTAWYNAADDSCYHGIAFPIVFDITSLNLQLPDQVVVGISYNTTHFGPNPIGEATACFTTDNNCPYDSLNVSTQGGPTIGSDIDPTSIFVNYTLPANSCSHAAPTGIMEEDLGCWAGYHPEIEVDTTPGDSFLIHYASNLNIGDSVINLTNAGTLNGADPAGRICVNVYTFDPAEEMVSCCSCLVTPNGLNSLSTVSDLISNPLTLGVPTSVVIKLTATAPAAGTCNAAVSADFVPGLRAWGSTLHQNTATGAYNVTESPFAPAVLSASEISKDISMCNFIQTNGSGYGICKSCESGGLSGIKR